MSNPPLEKVVLTNYSVDINVRPSESLDINSDQFTKINKGWLMYYVPSSCQRCLLLLVVVVASAGFFSGELSAQYSSLAPPRADLKEGFDSINIEQSQEWLGILAGPKFEGRGTGQPGYTKAAHWVAGKLAEFGLEPMGDDGTYFQMLPMKKRA